MTAKLNRCYWQAASAGTGAFAYDSTIAGHLSPANAEAVDGAQYAVIAENGSPPTEWEISIGVYDLASNSISRGTVVESSNGGAAVDFTAAPKVRMGVPLAADFPVGGGGISSQYIYLAGFNFSGPLDSSDDAVLKQAHINSFFSSGDFSGCTALEMLAFNCTIATAVTLTGCSVLRYLDLSTNALATLDLSGLTALQNAVLHTNQLATLDVTGCAALVNIDATGNALTEAGVDDILVTMDGLGSLNGVIDMLGGTNAAPSGTGASAKASLEGKGWAVNVN